MSLLFNFCNLALFDHLCVATFPSFHNAACVLWEKFLFVCLFLLPYTHEIKKKKKKIKSENFFVKNLEKGTPENRSLHYMRHVLIKCSVCVFTSSSVSKLLQNSKEVIWT